MTDEHSRARRGGARADSNGGQTLGSLLAGVTSKLNKGWRLDRGFDDRLIELEGAIKRRAHEELSEPMTGGDVEFRLHLIRRAYKHAEFTEELRKAGENLYHHVRRTQLRTRADYFKACTLAYELHDNYHIDPEINVWAAEEARGVFHQLQEKLGGRGADSARETFGSAFLREQILWCTCYGNELKRVGNTKEALKVFNTLYTLTDERVRTDEIPCHATLGILSYHLGSVHRMMEKHDLAEAMYIRAIEFYYKRSLRRPGELEEFIFSTRRVAMCIGLGIGWVNLTRGYLGRAENALATSRALVVHIDDPVVSHYIEMLWGTIRRCRAGSNGAALVEAVEALKKARRFFRKRRHPRYEARACWELALAYSRMRRYGASEKYLLRTEGHSLQSHNDKWKTNVHVLRSRNLLERGESEESLREAEQALVAAKSSGIPLPLVDALITRGAAKLDLATGTKQTVSTYSDALNDFREALQNLLPKGVGLDRVGQSLNPKIAAVCLLRIAQCYVRKKRSREAGEYLERWKGLRQHVEHRWVHELAHQVEGELEGITKDYTVPAGDPSRWNFKARRIELQDWLVEQALRNTRRDRKEAAKLLGLSARRLGQILDEAAERKKAEAAASRREAAGAGGRKSEK